MSPRRWVGLSIAVFWLVMMGWLWRRELGVQRLEMTPGVVDPLQETESWLILRLAKGQRVGQVHMKTGPETRRSLLGSRLDLAAAMQLNLLGKATDLEMEGHIWRPLEGRRVELQLAVRSADYDFQLDGVVSGGQLQGEIRSAGEVLPLELPISEEMLISSGFGAALQFPVLEVGETFLVDSFDPLTLSRGTARVRCLAEETLIVGDQSIATRRLEVRMSGIESLAWVDERGDVVKAETPFGLILERSTEAIVTATASGVGEAHDETAAGEDFLAMTSIVPSGLTPFRGARQMTVRLTGLNGDVAELPEGGGQENVEDGVYRLTAANVTANITANGVDEGSDLSPFLAADAFVQSDHETIRQQARDILGGQEDPSQQARLLHDWVFARLDKEAVLSIPSALEVLEKRRGDCNEHTVLFTALARSVGLPTKIAIGLVWSDELAGFYYHAWPEVWVDGRWRPMDPTLDQLQADATHLKLLEGGIESWPRLIPYLGRLEIEVLDVQ